MTDKRCNFIDTDFNRFFKQPFKPITLFGRGYSQMQVHVDVRPPVSIVDMAFRVKGLAEVAV